MKTICSLLAVLTVFSPPSASAAENAYDTLGKVLAPFSNLLAEKTRNPNRAVTMTLRLEEATDAPAELVGARVELAFQGPDKLKLRGPVLGQEVTVCRDGQELWGAPGEQLRALLNLATTQKKLPPPDPKFRLAPFKLPFSEKQLVFLPVLFRAQSAGQEEIGGELCQVLDLELMPELQRSAKWAKGWTARIWVRRDSTLARLKLTGPEGIITVALSEVKFQKSLPEATWEPAPEQDVLKLPPEQYNQLVRALLGSK